MANPKIVNYIKDTISQGYKEADVRAALIKQGWLPQEIDEAMGEVMSKAPSQKQAPVPEKAKLGVKQEKKDQGRGPGGGFLLTLIGGILIIINSMLMYLQVGDLLSLFLSNFEMSPISMLNVSLSGWDTFLITIIIGLFLLFTSFIIFRMPDKSRITGIFVIVLSLITVLIGGGFLIGGIVAIIGGLLAVLGR